MKKSLDQLVEEIFQWQQATFLDSTVEGRIKHFMEEVEEYTDNPNNGEEAADVFMLFVAIFKNHNIDLCSEVESKLQVNKARTWVKVPGGYSKHVRET
jgi:NTP pyrophosphatase (non-canonical NTP hydrolase)